MAGQGDYVTFGGGPFGSTVTMASPPDPSVIAFSAVSQLMAQRQKERALAIQMQRLNQQDQISNKRLDQELKLREQQFGIENRRLDQQADYQAKELDYRNRALNSLTDYREQNLDYREHKQDLLDTLNEINSRTGGEVVSRITDLSKTSQQGTAEWHDGYNDILRDPKFTGFLYNTKEGAQIRSTFEKQYEDANQGLKYAQTQKVKNFQNDLLNLLGQPFTKGGGYALENPGMWGQKTEIEDDKPVEKKFIRYDDAGNIYPAKVKANTQPNGQPWRFKTIDLDSWKYLRKGHVDVSNVSNARDYAGNAMSGRAMTRAVRDSIKAASGGDYNKARALARQRGYDPDLAVTP